MFSGCHLVLPEVSQQPLLHNPFPQLSKVAVAPFFNQSDEPTVDGREFAMAYFAELQDTPGYEIVPVGVVEEAIIRHSVNLSGPGEARRLAQILGVDAVVVGSVTDYSPYYPPRCGLRVEWYAANPGFHKIPAGYGLPWGTAQEEYIPQELVYEAEMELARAQMETQTPDCNAGCEPLSEPPVEFSPTHPFGPPLAIQPPFDASPMPGVGDEPSDESAGASESGAGTGEQSPNDEVENNAVENGEGDPEAKTDGKEAESLPAPPAAGGSASETNQSKVQQAKFDAPIDSDAAAVSPDSTTSGMDGATGAIGPDGILPPTWPDARGFTPAGPSPVRPECVPTLGPVMTHTRIYRGHDPEFTAALASYVSFRDDARFGGWQSYLERSDDFIRFCCHLHLSEMLTARGGGSETRVTRRWSESR